MSDIKVRIYWSIDGFTKNHGEPIALEKAIAWIKEMNKKHGAGTHWYE